MSLAHPTLVPTELAITQGHEFLLGPAHDIQSADLPLPFPTATMTDPNAKMPERKTSFSALLAAQPLARGVTVANTYRIEEELGRGGMGIVYRARDIWLDRTVALKVIMPGFTHDEQGELRLHQEAKALASVRNQHVVQVYAFGTHEGSFFFAMEYVKGRSLEALLEDYRSRRALLPQHRAATIVARIAEGLEAVHEKGLVHRDIKPANIVIEEDTGRAVLIDFGLALPGNQFDYDAIEGTPTYMAPEQAGLTVDGVTLGPWSDQYGLACVAFEMLTGQAPYAERDIVRLLHAHQNAPIPVASRIQAEAARFDDVLGRALSKATRARYPSCAVFGAEMLRAATPSTAPSIPPPTPHAVESTGRAIRILAVDDDPAFAKFASKAAELATRGRPVRIRVARSGQDALEMARLDPPDLVLLDLDMPHLDGIETLSHLRAQNRGDAARVVVLSGRVGPQERWKFAVLGVREFVPKPIDFRRLVETLQGIVERAGWNDPAVTTKDAT